MAAFKGDKPMSLQGRFSEERERLTGMTDEERMLRRQWLKDQELAPDEPLPMPEELYKQIRNPIRRFYLKPWDMLYNKVLSPVFGPSKAVYIRWLTPRAMMAVFGIYWIAYHFKYHQNDWTKKGGWLVYSSRPNLLPGDPGYPHIAEKDVSDYADRGFKKRNVFKDI